jgi:hypothetical protein
LIPAVTTAESARQSRHCEVPEGFVRLAHKAVATINDTNSVSDIKSHSERDQPG